MAADFCGVKKGSAHLEYTCVVSMVMITLSIPLAGDL